MSGFIPLVAALLMAALALDGRGAAPLSVPGILAFLGAFYASGRALGAHLAAGVEREGEDRGPAFGRFRRGLSFHRTATLPALYAILWPGGWARVVVDARIDYGDLPALLLAVLPWPVLLFLSRASTFPAERRLGLQPLPFLGSLLQTARMGSLVVVPVILLAGGALGADALAATDLPPFRQAADLAARYDFVAGAFLLGGLAAILLVFPVIAMRLLGARPMKDGPLRRRLEAYAARVSLPYRDLYVWETGGTLPNAAVLGVGRRLRCVLFTDALLASLDEEEVEAVFAHEAGHALHHHLPLFFLFTVGYMLALFAGTRFLPPAAVAALEREDLLAAGLTLAGMGVYFGLLFGFVSRRLEQQADVHGFLTTGLPEGEDARAVLRDPARHPFVRAAEAGTADPGSHPFVRGLDGIAAGVGGVREITGWRHFSIADRVEFLRRFAREPAVREEYARRLRLLLGLLASLLLLFAAAAATDIPVQLRGPAPASAVDRARTALLRGRVEEARRWIEAGVRGGEARGLVFSPLTLPLAPGEPAMEIAVLALAQASDDPGLPPGERVHLMLLEALTRSAAGRADDAAAAAARAVESVPPSSSVPAAARPRLEARRAESLLVLSLCLAEQGRPAAAAAARGAALTAARAAGEGALTRAAAEAR